MPNRLVERLRVVAQALLAQGAEVILPALVQAGPLVRFASCGPPYCVGVKNNRWLWERRIADLEGLLSPIEWGPAFGVWDKLFSESVLHAHSVASRPNFAPISFPGGPLPSAYRPLEVILDPRRKRIFGAVHASIR
jgi:hypothetical protein